MGNCFSALAIEGGGRKVAAAMTKQTPEQFARTVLYELAGIRSVVEQLRTELCIQIAEREKFQRQKCRSALWLQPKPLKKSTTKEFVASWGSTLKAPESEDFRLCIF